MERNIKYRFRLLINIESWGMYSKGDIDTFIISLDSLNRYPIDKRWDILSCDEYTGLNDSEGKGIYENDYCELGGGETVQIIFKDGGFGWVSAMDGESVIGFTGHNYFNKILLRIKVVGNIYDNSHEYIQKRGRLTRISNI